MFTLRETSVMLGLIGGSIGMVQADQASFEKDRQAILGMQGNFQVSFEFAETVSLAKDYQLKEKAYEAQAKEHVQVVQDDGDTIVLQHLLVVDGQVIKHWGQIWKYEDTEVLTYQGDRKWKSETRSAAEADGTWTQLVTQTNDMPRYESAGKWVHLDGVSYWQGETQRPLPRREYTRRKDYDLLACENRQTVTSNGWVHEQDNVKWVSREGKSRALCRERGFNRYERTDDELSAAKTFWEKNGEFWNQVRSVWSELLQRPGGVNIEGRVDFETINSTLGALEKKDAVTRDEILQALKLFISDYAAAK